jgi:hypothetical protein
MFDTASNDAGWLALRFTATNPGVWPLHCHILPHQLMGHALLLIVEPSKTEAPPASGLPACAARCNYQFTRFTTPLTAKVYGARNPQLGLVDRNGPLPVAPAAAAPAAAAAAPAAPAPAAAGAGRRLLAAWWR